LGRRGPGCPHPAIGRKKREDYSKEERNRSPTWLLIMMKGKGEETKPSSQTVLRGGKRDKGERRG